MIAVPPFELRHLRRGHAVHFRCADPAAVGLRIDVMTRMRGVEPFSRLWRRRVTVERPDRTRCDLMGIEDLIQAKKTQREKDWPMIQRLVEANYFEHQRRPTRAQVAFWLRELRTPSLLIEVARRWTAVRPPRAHADPSSSSPARVASAICS